jgi:hypothetical protein
MTDRRPNPSDPTAERTSEQSTPSASGLGGGRSGVEQPRGGRDDELAPRGDEDPRASGRGADAIEHSEHVGESKGRSSSERLDADREPVVPDDSSLGTKI